MPRTKANVIAAAERQKAIFAKKGPTAKGAEKRKGKAPVRSRQWRMKWFRQVRAAQSNKAASLNHLNATGMKRLVKEIQQDQRPDLVMRWQPEAIDAIREEAQARMTELFKVANAITVTCGMQTIQPKQLRLAAQFLGMELPPRAKKTLIARRPAPAEKEASSDEQTEKTESAS